MWKKIFILEELSKKTTQIPIKFANKKQNKSKIENFYKKFFY